MPARTLPDPSSCERKHQQLLHILWLKVCPANITNMTHQCSHCLVPVAFVRGESLHLSEDQSLDCRRRELFGFKDMAALGDALSMDKHLQITSDFLALTALCFVGWCKLATTSLLTFKGRHSKTGLVATVHVTSRVNP